METTAEGQFATTSESASEVRQRAEEDIESRHRESDPTPAEESGNSTAQETGAGAAATGAADEGIGSAFGRETTSVPPASSSAPYPTSEYATAGQAAPAYAALDYQQYSSKERRYYSGGQPNESVTTTGDLEVGVRSQVHINVPMDSAATAPTPHPGAYRVEPGGPPRGRSVDELRNEDPDTPSSVDYSPETSGASRTVSANDFAMLPPAPFVAPGSAEASSSDALPPTELLETTTGGSTSLYRQASLDPSILDSMVILAEANLVEDDDDDDEDASRSHIDATIVFQADPILMQDGMDVDGAEPQKNRGLGFWIMMVAIGLVTIAVVVGVSLVAVSRQGRSNDTSTLKNSTNITTLEELVPLFQASLPNYTSSELRDSTTPQSLAFRWVTSPANYAQLVNADGSPREELTARLVRRMTQQYALATLFYASSGDVWWVNNTGWLQGGVHECDWFGCACNETVGKKEQSDLVVRSLNLTDNGLARTPVPREMGLLMNLVNVDLSKNRLTGPLPTELGDLRRLSFLRIDSSEVTGSIPTEIGQLSLIRLLSLSSNRMTSVIPTEIGKLTNLVELDLARIHGDVSVRGLGLVGRLPSELFGLTQLEVLNLATSSLTGSLPDEIGNLKQLSSLALSNNYFSGTIPTQLGLLADLVDLLLVNNHTGTIPTELGLLTMLEQLLIAGEMLNGEIPTELGNCANMVVLFLDSTELDGTIPTELGSMSHLEIFSLYDTNITGTFPAGLCEVVTNGNLIVGIDCDEVSCDCGCKCGQLF